MNEPVVRRKPWLLILSGVLAVVIGTIYHFRPLALAGFYIWPLTIWVLIGVAVSLAAVRSPRKQRAGLVGVWMLVWFAMDDQPWAFIPRGSTTYTEFKIVSLNCAGGDPKAAEEAAAIGAEVILLQETPGLDSLKAIQKSLGADWTVINGPDGSILTRGPARRIPLPIGTPNFVAAEWDGTLVVSLRLQPPIFRLDYWSPDCWRDYARNRESRMAELREVMDWVRANKGNRDLIIGGDFNTPPDRHMMESLQSMATDTFADAGIGWGATAINSFPMVRIDQIWVGGNIVPGSARAKTVEHSDHRMVIATAYRPT